MEKYHTEITGVDSRLPTVAAPSVPPLFKIGEVGAGRIVFQLYSEAAPKTRVFKRCAPGRGKVADFRNEALLRSHYFYGPVFVPDRS